MTDESDLEVTRWPDETSPVEAELRDRLAADGFSSVFRWQDTSPATNWKITFITQKSIPSFSVIVSEKNWQPDPSTWEMMKQNSTAKDLIIHPVHLRKML